MFIDNKYTKWYYQIINNAKTRKLDISSYSETHHIIPKALNGTNNSSNLVSLTAREHFICHWLLTKMTNGTNKSSMIYALLFMQQANKEQQRYSTLITSRVYENHKLVHSMIVSKNKKGKPLSQETKLKMSLAKKGRTVSEETKLKMSLAKKGKRSNRAGTVVTPETRAKLSAALKGKPKSEATKEKFQNRKHSEETKTKLSKLMTGKKRGSYKKKLDLAK
jgi:hypothetical protein